MWLTIREYAEKNKITTQAVRDRIKNNNLQHRKHGGRLQVYVDDDDIPASPQQAPPALTQDEEDAIYNANYKAKMAEKQNVETELRK